MKKMNYKKNMMNYLKILMILKTKKMKILKY